MSQYGVWTRDQNGKTLMFSPLADGVFFNGAATYLNDAAIPTNNFTNNVSISTPLEPFRFRRGFQGGQGGFSVDATGSVNDETFTYFAPRLNLLTGTPYPLIGLNPTASFVHTFGTPPPPPANDYGFRSIGRDQQAVSVDSRNRSFYIHPDPSGNFIRTGTTISLPSNLDPVSTVPITEQPTTPNIVFEREFDTPPLVFVTKSTGPIALNFMARNAAGKYIGMSVAANATLTSTSFGTAAVQSNSYTFDYFLVAPEEPIFGTPSNYGMQVFNQNGVKVFDSAYFEPVNFRSVIAKPAFELKNVPANYFINFVPFTGTSGLGVCLNNMNLCTGVAFFTAVQLPDQVVGPVNFAGRFLEVGDNTATISGNASNAIFARFFTGSFPTGVPFTFEWNKGVAPNQNVLFANFEYT